MATTTSVRAVKVEGEGMTVRTRRYECLFPGNWQGAVHMRTKGTTRRKVVFAQDKHGDPETALAVKVMTWLERAVQRLGDMPVLGRSARVAGDVPECVREGCEMRGEQAQSSMGDRWEAFE